MARPSVVKNMEYITFLTIMVRNGWSFGFIVQDFLKEENSPDLARVTFFCSQGSENTVLVENVCSVNTSALQNSSVFIVCLE